MTGHSCNFVPARFFATCDVSRDNNSLAPRDHRVTTTIGWKIIFRFARFYFRFDRYGIYLKEAKIIIISWQKVFSKKIRWRFSSFFFPSRRILEDSPFKDSALSLLRRIIQIYARASKLSVAASQRKSGIQVSPSSCIPRRARKERREKEREREREETLRKR